MGAGGGANWKGECPMRPILGWVGVNCWAIRGWGPAWTGRARAGPTAPPLVTDIAPALEPLWYEGKEEPEPWLRPPSRSL